MNLRNVGDYNIGLDIGTGSVGWAVTDSEGNLLHFNGKPAWGSRLFPEANKASEARTHRSLRRRYNRRRWRLDLLQMLFEKEVDGIDSEFFIRLKQSHLFKEDRDAKHSEYLWPLFNDPSFDEKAYYEQFPTVYHLRKWLMETTEKADIRLIYLAFHNIVKHRGNFLQHDNKSLSAEKADVKESVERFCLTLEDWCDIHDIHCAAMENTEEISDILHDINATKSALKEKIAPLLALQINDDATEGLDKKAASNLSKAIASALVGVSFKPEQIFFISEEKPESVPASMYISNDDQVEALKDVAPDDSLALIGSIEAVYSAYVLQEILSLAPGKSLSINKVKEYERYGENLSTLKALVKDHVPEKYNEFFRGPVYEKLYRGEKTKYDKSKVKGYTRYNEVRHAPYDDFKKSVIELFKGTLAVDDPRYIKMVDDFESERFLRRLKTSDNGSIPYQLHLEEMDKIIENQGSFYPFLKEDRKKLNSLVEFRIPYYVGPLTTKNARRAGDKSNGEMRFAWSVKKSGKEGERIFPWNWEEIIDKDKSAEKFITRMTGTCTYLQGEPVLPKNSLLYQEFCVLNELNGAHFTQDGDKHRRFDYADRFDMVDELFKNGSVSYKKVADWMTKRGNANVHVSGGQGEKGFESRLSSYIFFKKDIFDVDEIPESDYPMIEDIILWNTIFEDRDILAQKLKTSYGNRLSDEQVKKICKKRFTGWGRLSRKFLTGIKTHTDNGDMSIMDVLREGDPTNGHGTHAMVLMEALRDDRLHFQELVDKENTEKFYDVTQVSLDEIPGSPGIRRAINQTLAIVKEIVHIAGHAPENVFVEVTRSEGPIKGQRTQTRYRSLEEQLSKLKEESPEFWSAKVSEELKSHAKSNSALSEKLTLYFMQGGKSLYSGKPLYIDRLSEYQVDHILPQSYIKDDSFENKALVLREENQRKSDQMLLPADMQKQMKVYWTALHDAKLIGDKKFNNLLREEIREKQLKGFINRQIVETSQIVKTVQMMLSGILPDSDIFPVKAGLSSELRRRLNLFKCREVNNFHHAHDALLACEIGRFINARFPEMYSNPLAYQKVIRKFVQQESKRVKRGHVPYNSSFIISSFMKTGFDEETGEITHDTWNADTEKARIRKYFSYWQCYVTRMPELTTGSFWNDTIYSPHGGKKAAGIRLKNDLSIEKYGGYSGIKYAYFVFISASDSKGKAKRLFEGVPVSIYQQIESGKLGIEEWAKDLVQSRGLELVCVLRDRLLKYSRISHNGNEFYVPALDCVYSARELVLDQHLSNIAYRVCSDGEVDDESLSQDELIALYQGLKQKCLTLCARFKSVYECLVEGEPKYHELDKHEKRSVLINLLNFYNGTTPRVDLRLIGGSPNAGKIANGFLRDPKEELCIIDQSITGMFERRTYIGL